ncbi:MAG: exodeoxyribonuclease VII small subunit [Coriobacteriia bacterium]|nr:exodeoxyribonuclease VII small subunit [Coriobacteriia bacterium]
MADERYNFAQARVRLEEIVAEVRKKDTSLEKSLDLLEEGVRLANSCTELSDHTEWRSVAEEQAVAEEQTAVTVSEDGREDASPSDSGAEMEARNAKEASEAAREASPEE